MLHLPAHRVFRLFVPLMMAVIVCSAASVSFAAPSPSAFQELPVWGVEASQVFTSGELSYTLTISPDARLIFQGKDYPIEMIWGFFAVNKTGDDANDLVAIGPANGEWKWDQHKSSDGELNVAGWFDAPKHEAMLRPASGEASKTFTYSELEFDGEAPRLGLHVSVSVPEGKASPFGSGLTGAIIPVGQPAVPEPSGLLGLWSGTIGFAGYLIRRRRR